ARLRSSPRSPTPPLFPSTTLFRSSDDSHLNFKRGETFSKIFKGIHDLELKYADTGIFLRGKYWYDFELKDEDRPFKPIEERGREDRKSTRLNSSHVKISYAVFCLK